MDTRRILVPGAVVVGLVALTVAVQYGRDLGPSGRAAGSPVGCGSEDAREAARALVVNPDARSDITQVAQQPGLDAQVDISPQPESRAYVVKILNEYYGLTDDVGFDIFQDEISRLGLTPGDHLGTLDIAMPIVGSTTPQPFERGSVLAFTGGQLSVEDTIQALHALEIVEWAEPIFIAKAMAMVDNPAYPLQWNLDIVNAPAAWALSYGAGVTVAVLDTGLTPTPDGPRYVVPGYDFVDIDNAPLDPNGHGTRIASIIASAHDDGTGIAGIAPEAQIMPVRVLDEDGRGRSVDIAAGALWAIDHGADILVLPLGLYPRSQLLDEILDIADQADVLVVAAAGNESRTDRSADPAQHSSVMSVGAIEFDLQVAPYSNRGRGVEIYAPGGNLGVDDDGDGLGDGVLTNGWIVASPAGEARARSESTPDQVVDGVFLAEGTSVAAAHVAGGAALVMSYQGSSAWQVRRSLTNAAATAGYPVPVLDIMGAMVQPTMERPEGNLVGQLESLSFSELRNTRAEVRWITPQQATTECWVFGDHRQRFGATGSHRMVVPYATKAVQDYECASTAADGTKASTQFTVVPLELADQLPNEPQCTVSESVLICP